MFFKHRPVPQSLVEGRGFLNHFWTFSTISQLPPSDLSDKQLFKSYQSQNYPVNTLCNGETVSKLPQALFGLSVAPLLPNNINKNIYNLLAHMPTRLIYWSCCAVCVSVYLLHLSLCLFARLSGKLQTNYYIDKKQIMNY